MNAMEHGNHYRPEIPVIIKVRASQKRFSVQITDQGGGKPIPEPEIPDLEAKLAGLQSPRGWGLFLMRRLVDEVRTRDSEAGHTVELVLRRDGAAR